MSGAARGRQRREKAGRNTGRSASDDAGPRRRREPYAGGIMAVAKKDVVTVPPTTTIMGAARTMVGYGYRRVPVADAGSRRLKGICTVADIIDFLCGGRRRIIEKVYDGQMIVAINGPVTEIMESDVATVGDDASLEDAIRAMVDRSVGGVPVVDPCSVVVGIVTERDIVRLTCEADSPRKVGDIMSRRVTTAPPDMAIGAAARTMIASGFRRLPVVADGYVCGIITATDIMRYLGKGDAFKKLVTGNVDEAFSAPIGSIMRGDIVTVGPRQDLGPTARLMLRNGVGSLPVIENQQLVGIVTERDILLAMKA